MGPAFFIPAIGAEVHFASLPALPNPRPAENFVRPGRGFSFRQRVSLMEANEQKIEISFHFLSGAGENEIFKSQ